VGVSEMAIRKLLRRLGGGVRRGHRADSPEPIVVTPALAVGRWLAGGPAPGTGGLFQTGIARWLDESDKW